MTDDLATLDATAQADLVRSGAMSRRELVDAAIARIETINPEINAVIATRFERAVAEAEDRPPHGRRLPRRPVPAEGPRLPDGRTSRRTKGCGRCATPRTPPPTTAISPAGSGAPGSSCSAVPTRRSWACCRPRSPTPTALPATPGIRSGPPGARAAGRPQRWQPGSSPSPTAPTAVGRSVSPQPHAGSSDSSPRADASRSARTQVS